MRSHGPTRLRSGTDANSHAAAKAILDHILRVLKLPGQPPGQSQHPPVVTPHQSLERRTLPAPARSTRSSAMFCTPGNAPSTVICLARLHLSAISINADCLLSVYVTMFTSQCLRHNQRGENDGHQSQESRKPIYY